MRHERQGTWKPTIVSAYIVRQVLPWFLIALVGAILVFLVTQLVRIAPLFIGHGAGVEQTLIALSLLVVPVVGWALTPALAIALFATGGRMARDGELTRFDAAGFSRARLVIGPIALCLLIAVLCAWIWLDAAPRSQRMLRSLAVSLAEGSLSGQIVPGRFYRNIPGVTFYAETAAPEAGFGGVFIEITDQQGGKVQAMAKAGRTSRLPGSGEVIVQLDHGTAFMGKDDFRGGAPAALSFEHLELHLPLAEEIERRLDFLPRSQAVSSSRLFGPPLPGIPELEWRFSLWRRIAGPIGALLLSLLAVQLAFNLRWRSQGLAVGLAMLLFLSFHVLGRFTETLLYSGHLPVIHAALLPAAAVGLALVILLLYPQLRKYS